MGSKMSYLSLLTPTLQHATCRARVRSRLCDACTFVTHSMALTHFSGMRLCLLACKDGHKYTRALIRREEHAADTTFDPSRVLIFVSKLFSPYLQVVHEIRYPASFQ
eukprot:m.161010 g.161010  ORF g.161010 m.161010 type:complete len:107 (+) comp18044_c0_seq9:2040-2360(+)